MKEQKNINIFENEKCMADSSEKLKMLILLLTTYQ